MTVLNLWILFGWKRNQGDSQYDFRGAALIKELQSAKSKRSKNRNDQTSKKRLQFDAWICIFEFRTFPWVPQVHLYAFSIDMSTVWKLPNFANVGRLLVLALWNLNKWNKNATLSLLIQWQELNDKKIANFRRPKKRTKIFEAQKPSKSQINTSLWLY